VPHKEPLRNFQTRAGYTSIPVLHNGTLASGGAVPESGRSKCLVRVVSRHQPSAETPPLTSQKGTHM